MPFKDHLKNRHDYNNCTASHPLFCKLFPFNVVLGFWLGKGMDPPKRRNILGIRNGYDIMAVSHAMFCTLFFVPKGNALFGYTHN